MFFGIFFFSFVFLRRQKLSSTFSHRAHSL
jgi:hypothetical protein